jgi:hypothetical protein
MYPQQPADINRVDLFRKSSGQLNFKMNSISLILTEVYSSTLNIPVSNLFLKISDPPPPSNIHRHSWRLLNMARLIAIQLIQGMYL